MTPRVETVRGNVSDDRAAQILELWSSHGALTGDAARERLREVVCVLLDDANRVAGVSSVYEAVVPLIGEHRFAMYRRFAPDIDDETEQLLARSTYDALDAERSETGPVGLCVVVDDVELLRRRPEGVWPETQLLHAGYLPNGKALRVRYFTDAIITTPLPGRRLELPPRERMDEVFPLGDEYAIHRFGETDAVSADDVVALWRGEGVLSDEAAARRVAEVVLVATHGDELVAVMTAYLRRNDQLRIDAWYERAFVAEAHRRSNLAMHLAVLGIELLEERHVRGEDTRGVGTIIEVEHPGLRGGFPIAFWPLTKSHYIGTNERGATVYVRYFLGTSVI